MNPIPTKKLSPSAKAGLVSASVSKPKPKKMIANHGPTITGALKVQQMLEGTFVVHGSDTIFHSALLPFNSCQGKWILHDSMAVSV